MMHPTQRNTSARRSATVRDGAPASDTKSLPARPKKVRFAHDEPRDVRGHHREESKASRAPTSPLDAAWGTLFRPTGDPTRRMGDILRGLATYLIETFPPDGSLVLEPDRMRRFYRHYRQRREAVDWERLFTMSNRSLETLYLALQCDYHLVQAPGARPRRAASLPALTPQGFAHWSALMLSAFPDNEARRLQDVVADLPLEAVPQGLGQGPGPGPGPGQGHGQGGGLRSPRERLPRRISRCLLPDRAHPDTLRLVLRALSGLADAPARCSDRHETRPYNRGADAITVEEDGGRRRSFTCTRPRFEREQRGHDGGRRLSQPRYQEARDAAAKWWHPTRPPRYPPEKWKDGGRWADEA